MDQAGGQEDQPQKGGGVGDKAKEAAGRAAEAGKEAGKEAAKKVVKEAIKKAAQAAARIAAQLAAEAAAAVTAVVGWPVLLACIVIFLIIAAIFGGLICIASNGYFGKSYPVPAGSGNQDIQTAIQRADEPSRVNGYNKVIFKEQKDRDYISSGKLDARLAKALAYISAQHEMLRISHVISEYEYMNESEAGSDTDPRIIKNISAHKDGLAADLDWIDFVYKVIVENSACGAAADIISGGDAPVGDIVYYNDLNTELLRLPCADIGGHSINPNTTWNNLPAEGIPIKILYQDPKPPIKHAGNEPDPSLTTDPVEKMVYEMVYQPEARRKVNLVISELLQYPYETDDTMYYRITQLITYSQERDVQPFQDDGTLDKLYGATRPANFGLFYLLESWQNIHIGY